MVDRVGSPVRDLFLELNPGEVVPVVVNRCMDFRERLSKGGILVAILDDKGCDGSIDFTLTQLWFGWL